MNTISIAAEIVVEMHQRGFVNDFQLFRDNILWVQEKIFLKIDRFTILEFHQIWNPASNIETNFIIALIEPHLNIKGLLIKNENSGVTQLPAALLKKINKLSLDIFQQDNNKSLIIWNK